MSSQSRQVAPAAGASAPKTEAPARPPAARSNAQAQEKLARPAGDNSAWIPDFETEIASLVWEYELYVGSDDAGHQNPLGSPGVLMVSLMRNLQSQWAPDLVEPLFTGLYQRFAIDPAVSDDAAEFFKSSAETQLGVHLR